MSNDNGPNGIPAEARPADGLVGIDPETYPVTTKTATGNLVLTPRGSEVLVGFLGLWLQEQSYICHYCSSTPAKHIDEETDPVCATCASVWDRKEIDDV